jgi:hypothetical protein
MALLLYMNMKQLIVKHEFCTMLSIVRTRARRMTAASMQNSIFPDSCVMADACAATGPDGTPNT